MKKIFINIIKIIIGAYMFVLALLFLVCRPQGLFGEKIIERV